jgi:hypothetical protein
MLVSTELSTVLIQDTAICSCCALILR